MVSNSSCTLCPPNFYKENLDLQPCSSCPVGGSTSGATGATSVTACQLLLNFTKVDNYTYGCSLGYGYNGNGGCSICEPDSFKDTVDLLECVKCPVGSTTNNLRGASNSALCTMRPTFVLVDPSTQSYGCPKGTGLSANNDSCVTCGVDAFQADITLAACSSCPNGSTTFDQNGQAYCWETSKYSFENSQLVCGAGYYSESGLCVSCPADTYKASSGNSTCSSCPVGTTTKNATSATLLTNCVQIADSSISKSTDKVSSVVFIGVGTGVACFVAAVLGVALYVLHRRKKQRKSVTGVRNATKLEGKWDQRHSLDTSHRVSRHASSKLAIFDSRNLVSTSINPITTHGSNWIDLHSERQSRSTLTLRLGATATMSPTSGLYTAFPAFLLVDSEAAFRCRELIAEGGFAKLYKGDIIDKSVIPPQMIEANPDLPQNVAIKVFKVGDLSDQDAQMEELISSLENEATIMYALASLPNVAKLLAISKEPRMAIAMQFYEESLEHFIYAERSIYRDKALSYCNNSYPLVCSHLSHHLLDGLAAMHMLNVVHLDLKPGNFMIEHLNGNTHFPFRLVITDFGLARFTEDMRASKASACTTTAGLSLRYASPEAFIVVRLLAKKYKVRKESFMAMDAYSAAVSIWELFAREIPLKSIRSEMLEAEISNGAQLNYDKLPVPATPEEKTIMKTIKALVKGGTSFHPESRLLAIKMQENISQSLSKILAIEA